MFRIAIYCNPATGSILVDALVCPESRKYDIRQRQNEDYEKDPVHANSPQPAPLSERPL